MKVIYANTFFKRFKGLMGKKNFNNVMIFTNLKDSSIHTMFMRFEIDVYFIDESKFIFEKTSMKPWKFHKPKKQAKYIMETKKGLLKLKTGDYLDFI